MAIEFKCSKANLLCDWDPAIDIVNCIINSLTSVTATVVNLLVIISIWRTPSLHTPSNVLVVGLALSDFCVGFVVQPIFLARTVSKIKGLQDMYCSSTLAEVTTGFCFTAVTLMTLTAISLDRYIGIKLHLRYREVVTVRRVIAVLVSIWVAFIVSATSILWMHFTFISPLSIANTALNLTVTGFTYFMIYRVVRRHKTQIRAQLQVQQWQQDEHSTNVAQLNKSSWSMFLISFAFVLCCLPRLVISIVLETTGKSCLSLSLFEVSFLLVYINSTMNPALYCWRFKQIRLAVVQTTKSIFRRGSSE